MTPTKRDEEDGRENFGNFGGDCRWYLKKG